MVKGSTWRARVAAGVEELGAREVVELEADELMSRVEEAVVVKLDFEAVMLVEGGGRQV